MWERRLVDAVLRHRLAVLVGVGLLTVLAAVFAGWVRFDSNIEIWFLEDDESLVRYHAFLERFDGVRALLRPHPTPRPTVSTAASRSRPEW